MRTQEEILNKLIQFETNSSLDPFKFKREMLVRFASTETLSKVAPIRGDNIDRINTNDLYSVIMHFHALLNSAYIAVSHTAYKIAVERFIQHIEIYLWLFEDVELLEQMKLLDNEKAQISFIQILLKKYGS